MLKACPGARGQQALPRGRRLESLQARFEEIQGLEEEGGACATDGAAQESLDHRVQLQGRHGCQQRGRTWLRMAETHLAAPWVSFRLERREKRSGARTGLQGCRDHGTLQGELSGLGLDNNFAPTEQHVYFIWEGCHQPHLPVCPHNQSYCPSLYRHKSKTN